MVLGYISEERMPWTVIFFPSGDVGVQHGIHLWEILILIKIHKILWITRPIPLYPVIFH
jgi:hypothetical protein